MRLKQVLYLCLSLVLVYCLYFFSRFEFRDDVWFGGDSWDYQSTAVNMVKGHGMRFGAIEDFGVYKFGKGYKGEVKSGSDSEKYFLEIGRQGGSQTFFTTPGYYWFLAGIYEIFGIRPVIVKQIQLFLMILVASLLPFLGFIYWKRQGLVAGIVAGMVWLVQYTRPLPEQILELRLTFPDQILSEALVSFTIFVIVVSFCWWQKKKSSWSSFLVGLLMGGAMLLKGSLNFLAVLVFLDAIYLVYKGQLRLKFLGLMGLGWLLMVGPWSVYVSRKLGKPVFVSNQGEAVLLAGNNEFSLDGGWHPEGITEGFYVREDVVNLPTYQKVFKFYGEHLEMIPMIFVNKINRAFDFFVFFKLGLLLLLARILFRIRRELGFLMWGVASWYLLSSYKNYFLKTIPPFSFWFSTAFLLSVAVLLWLWLKKKKAMVVDIPLPFLIIFGNFLILTVLTLGMERLIQVMDFIFILVGVKWWVSFLVEIKAKVSKQK